jgi:hypothetical protein
VTVVESFFFGGPHAYHPAIAPVFVAVIQSKSRCGIFGDESGTMQNNCVLPRDDGSLFGTYQSELARILEFK